MSSRLLINVLWTESITPEMLMEMLGWKSYETLYRKVYDLDPFTPEEVEKISNHLGLTEEEKKAIFG